MTQPQLASAVMMIRPLHFGSNPETAATNAFQNVDDHDARAVAMAAIDEFDVAVVALEAAGIRTVVFEDRPEPFCTDATFPNNWMSTHPDGTVVTYPMHDPSRQREVRQDLIDALGASHGYRVERVIDLCGLREQGHFVEGTGSLVLDRPNRIAYACQSPRTTAEGVRAFCDRLGYDARRFHGVCGSGREIYHTNVMLSVGERFALLCADAIPDTSERQHVITSLLHSGRELITFSLAQLDRFAGNALQVRGTDGAPRIVLSTTAWTTFDEGQRQALQAHGTPVPIRIPTIETYGGGSIRCMMCEVFLPRANAPS
ncbi:MAG: amidinotransferase [Planctomycetes bacterium]|nr:amidinotransferase [Planctomycetota bacterium]